MHKRIGISILWIASSVALSLCAGAQTDPAPSFVPENIGATRSRVQFDTGKTSSVGGSMFLVCHTAAHVGERGFKYFRIVKQRTKSKGKGSFEIELFLVPPAGEKVLYAGLPSDVDPANALMQATSWIDACRDLGVLPRSPAANQ